MRVCGDYGLHLTQNLSVGELPKEKLRFLNGWTASGTGTGNWLAMSAYYWGNNEEYCDIEGPLVSRMNLHHNNVSPCIGAYVWRRIS